MAQPHRCGSESTAQLDPPLERLLGLYAQQKQLYQRILQLSREQGKLVQQGGSLRQVRQILERKRECLDQIACLQQEPGGVRSLLEQGREHWSAAGRARLHRDLQEVGALIEEILLCEEENDRYLLEQFDA
jgi:hypothetical protein